MIIECDDNVYNPLGGGSYVFEKDIANFLLNKFWAFKGKKNDTSNE